MKYHTEEYLDYVRKFPHCSLCYKKGPVEPHHINQIGMGRNRKNPLIEHYSAIPVCRPCHTEYHNLGMKVYCNKHQVNAFEIAHYFLSKFLKDKYI